MILGLDGQHGRRRRAAALRRLRAHVRAARGAGGAHAHVPAALARPLAPSAGNQEDRNSNPQRLQQRTTCEFKPANKKY